MNAIIGWESENWAGPGGVAVDLPIWPVNLYGATKCFGEALARVFSSTHGPPWPSDLTAIIHSNRIMASRWDATKMTHADRARMTAAAAG